MSFAYMRVYTGDYLKSTAQLSIVEHGAYWQLLMYCWDHDGELPTDEKTLARICHATTAGQIQAINRVLFQYFLKENGKFICKRVKKELAKSETVSQTRSAAALKRHHSAPVSRDAYAVQTDMHMQDTPYPYPESVTTTSKEKATSKPFAPTDEKLSLGADGKWHGVSEERLAVWHAAFPAVDLQAEMAKAAAWVLSNPQHKKSNYARFLNTWFAKAQDRACQPPRYPTQPSAAERRDADHHRRLQVLRVLPPDQPVAPAMHFANPFDDAFTLEDDHARLIDGSKH